MGSVKDNMKSKDGNVPKKSDVKSSESIFGRFSKRIKKQDSPQTFADMIEQADECLNRLLTEKEIELKKESGDERYNTRALAHLEAMRFHLDCVIDHAGSYGELKR